MNDIKKRYHDADKASSSKELSNKHSRTLERIFQKPVVADLEWREVEGLIGALGGTITEGNGSRKRIVLNGVRAVFHEPHPQKEIDKGAVKSLRSFLENAGVVDSQGKIKK